MRNGAVGYLARTGALGRLPPSFWGPLWAAAAELLGACVGVCEPMECLRTPVGASGEPAGASGGLWRTLGGLWEPAGASENENPC